MLILFAQVAAGMGEWASGLVQAGCLGIVAWIVWYMFGTGLPEMNKRHADEMAAQRDAHIKVSVELREAHTGAIAKLTESNEKQAERNRMAIEAMLKGFKEELTLERASCTAERALDREARHATANAINSVGLSLALLNETHPEIKKAREAALANKAL